MVLILTALGDPGAEDGLVLGGYRLLRFGRRHDVVRVVGKDAVDDFALVGLTGDDGEFARLAFTVGRFREVEAEFTFTRMVVHAVASEAMLGEDRADFLVEVDGEEARGGDQKQGCGRKSEHGAEGAPGGVRPDDHKTVKTARGCEQFGVGFFVHGCDIPKAG